MSSFFEWVRDFWRDNLEDRSNELWDTIRESVTGSDFYLQVGAVTVAIILAFLLSFLVRRRIRDLINQPQVGTSRRLQQLRVRTNSLVFPGLSVVCLSIAIELSSSAEGEDWLVRIAQSIAVTVLLFQIISKFVESPFLSSLFKWVVIPVATLSVYGWLDEVARYLDGLSLEVGSLRISALALSRTLVFGAILFWLGNISSTIGAQVIRNREALDIAAREVSIKILQIVLFVVFFLLLLSVMGVNLTALAVFGGALGVGLGFGLQHIAANFVSGIIVLLDRSIRPGDYIAFEDGRAGTLRELKMRSATLETFDGKDIMVPNEQFITSSFVNWTHKNKKQRYSLEFSVAYKTDLQEMLRIVKQVVVSHPQVLSGPDLPIEERPDAEISSFGDSGINILVEFWMLGIDDGVNHVGADLLLMIWDALKENSIEIPFPQRDVRIVRPS